MGAISPMGAITPIGANVRMITVSSEMSLRRGHLFGQNLCCGG